MFNISKEKFINNYNANIPQILKKKVIADTETPVSTLLKISADQEYSFLLESVEGGEQRGRFSLLGCDPDLIWSVAKNNVELKNMLTDAKSTSKSLGFKEGTNEFSNCALKLYAQSMELAAKQNQQVVIQGGSGSNVMTIYDPVRDSNALMQKGQKMLSGGCTLGINC